MLGKFVLLFGSPPPALFLKAGGKETQMETGTLNKTYQLPSTPVVLSQQVRVEVCFEMMNRVNIMRAILRTAKQSGWIKGNKVRIHLTSSN